MSDTTDSAGVTPLADAICREGEGALPAADSGGAILVAATALWADKGCGPASPMGTAVERGGIPTSARGVTRVPWTRLDRWGIGGVDSQGVVVQCVTRLLAATVDKHQRQPGVFGFFS
jgi:hypothetical protein